MLIKVKNDLPNDKTFGTLKGLDRRLEKQFLRQRSLRKQVSAKVGFSKVFKYKVFTLKRATLNRELGRLILNYPYSLSSNVVRVREFTKKLRVIKNENHW